MGGLLPAIFLRFLSRIYLTMSDCDLQRGIIVHHLRLHFESSIILEIPFRDLPSITYGHTAAPEFTAPIRSVAHASCQSSSEVAGKKLGPISRPRRYRRSS